MMSHPVNTCGADDFMLLLSSSEGQFKSDEVEQRGTQEGGVLFLMRANAAVNKMEKWMENG